MVEVHAEEGYEQIDVFSKPADISMAKRYGVRGNISILFFLFGKINHNAKDLDVLRQYFFELWEKGGERNRE